ncbi:sugar ABC transporter substrate-binding protein [Paenibacillus sp. JMULE4]|uniref:ABC transporter substrate-binding protein n=1 Tax=Paenibacillus TaxID=44249 RepID=UPI0015772754|nr:sugar ABC transporter substrate-binding protein [Paenibacillus sp. JMULE4]NTZ20396.1 sugar ABC transporter substrate-binding protein [Paenibacillus sp. JMULE4]
MKKWPRALFAGMMAVSLTACGAAQENNGSAGEKASEPGKTTSIRMQITWASDSPRGKAIREIVDEFEKKNPDVKVELLGSAQNGQKLLTQILSGDAPEVMQIPYRDVRGLAPQGAYVDLSEEFNSEKDNYYEQLWELGTWDGKLYGYPWLGHSVQLVYNKTLFDKAGIQHPPTTWEELYETAKKLTIDTNGDGKPDQFGLGLVGKQVYDITWMVNMFMNQAGAKIVKEDGKGGYQVGLNSPEGKQALEFYTKLVKEVTPPDTVNKDGGAVMADFRNQVVAMQFQGPWGVSDAWKATNKFEVAAAEVPAGPAGKAADIGPNMLCIPSGVEGDKLNAAIRLIKFLGSKEGQELVMKGEKSDDGNFYPYRVPIRKDLADMPYFKEHPEFLVFIKGLEYPSISTPVPQWSQVEAEVYQSVLNQVVSGSMSAEQGLKILEEKGNAILKQN